MTEYPHYLRFARSLALVTTLVLPACSSSDPSSEGQTGTGPAAASKDPAPPATSAPPSDAPVAAATEAATTPPAGTADASADAGATDGSPGHVSGPLPPPELPAELA